MDSRLTFKYLRGRGQILLYLTLDIIKCILNLVFQYWTFSKLKNGLLCNFDLIENVKSQVLKQKMFWQAEYFFVKLSSPLKSSWTGLENTATSFKYLELSRFLLCWAMYGKSEIDKHGFMEIILDCKLKQISYRWL